MRIVLLSFLLLPAMLVGLHGQCLDSPLETARQYLSPSTDIPRQDMINGDFRDRDSGKPDGTMISTDFTLNFSVLAQGHYVAVVAIESVDSVGKAQDIYLYLNHSDKWRINAIRTMPDLDMYQKMVYDADNYGMDSLKADLDRSGRPVEMERLRSDVDRARLMLMADKELCSWFSNNQEKFNLLTGKIIQGYAALRQSKASATWTSPLADSLVSREELDSAMLAGVEIIGGSSIKYVIGGMRGSEIGIIFCSDPSALPQISEKEYIMVRKLKYNWFLYRKA